MRFLFGSISLSENVKETIVNVEQPRRQYISRCFNFVLQFNILLRYYYFALKLFEIVYTFVPLSNVYYLK